MTYRAPITCEVQTNTGWLATTATEAHYEHRDALKRCPDCYGPMFTIGSYMGQRKASLQHHRTHEGCPRAQRHFTGTRTQHPEALM